MPGREKYATSLLKAMDVLEALGEDTAVSLADISRRSGLEKTTVFRVLATFALRGYVERVGSGGMYRLGLRSFELGMRAVAGRDVRTAAEEPMRRLLARTGELVNLGVPTAEGVVILERIQGDRAVQMRSRVGEHMPFDTTSIGRAYLATLEPSQAEERFPSLAAELAAARKRGYAVDDCTYLPDLRCASAPIRDRSGGVAGMIGISAPAYRLSLQKIHREVGPAVLGAAREITIALGGDLLSPTQSPSPLRVTPAPRPVVDRATTRATAKRAPAANATSGRVRRAAS
jgi:DNA-binding IclR family transcriptional regulator